VHKRWDDPELRAVIKLAAVTLAGLLVAAIGWGLYFLW